MSETLDSILDCPVSEIEPPQPSGIAAVFAKPVDEWTPEDVRQTVEYYQAHPEYFHLMDPKTGELKPPKPAKKTKTKASDPRQIDLEELIAKEAKP